MEMAISFFSDGLFSIYLLSENSLIFEIKFAGSGLAGWIGSISALLILFELLNTANKI